jgi:hypothetical protein
MTLLRMERKRMTGETMKNTETNIGMKRIGRTNIDMTSNVTSVLQKIILSLGLMINMQGMKRII